MNRIEIETVINDRGPENRVFPEWSLETKLDINKKIVSAESQKCRHFMNRFKMKIIQR